MHLIAIVKRLRIYKCYIKMKRVARFLNRLKRLRKKSINQVFILKKVSEGIDGKEEVKQNKYAAYVELNKDGAKFYGSDKSSIEGSIVEGMLTTFVDKYNVAAEVAKVRSE